MSGLVLRAVAKATGRRCACGHRKCDHSGAQGRGRCHGHVIHAVLDEVRGNSDSGDAVLSATVLAECDCARFRREAA